MSDLFSLCSSVFSELSMVNVHFCSSVEKSLLPPSPNKQTKIEKKKGERKEREKERISQTVDLQRQNLSKVTALWPGRWEVVGSGWQVSGKKCRVCQVEVHQATSWSNCASAQVPGVSHLGLGRERALPFSCLSLGGRFSWVRPAQGSPVKALPEPGL